jgi:hypothetical protein
MGQPVTATITLVAANADGIAEAQTVTGGDDFVLDGALVTDGAAVLTSAGAGRQVIITSSGDDTGVIFTIEGADESGIPISEALAGADTAAATSALFYHTVTRVSPNVTTDGDVEVGTNGVGATRWVNYNIHAQPFNVVNAVDISGTVDFDLQYTYDPLGSITKIWTDAVVDGATADAQATYTFPITGSRILLNSGDGTVTMTAIQAGIRG